jgi:hypothetical protein
MKKQSRLRPLSNKRALEKRDYNKACREQDKKMLDEYGYLFCVSCGSQPSGGHSHNLPVKHFPQFENDPENFKLRCIDCHNALDFPNFELIILFRDFSQLLEYRKTHDIHAYNRWISALIAIGVTNYPYAEEK